MSGAAKNNERKSVAKGGDLLIFKNENEK